MGAFFKCTGFLMMLTTTVFMSGCANFPMDSDGNIDERLNNTLNKFCPIPNDTAKNHSIRAHMVLAAIAGYAYRSVQNYSKPSEASDDASRSISRINTAYATLKATDAIQSSGMYPIQRIDMIIDLAEAAEAAISPTLRAGKAFITSSVIDRVSLMKTAMIAFLEDKLYLDAYNKSCTNFSALNIQEIDARIKDRCNDLARIGGINPNTCNIQP